MHSSLSRRVAAVFCVLAIASPALAQPAPPAFVGEGVVRDEGPSSRADAAVEGLIASAYVMVGILGFCHRYVPESEAMSLIDSLVRPAGGESGAGPAFREVLNEAYVQGRAHPDAATVTLETCTSEAAQAARDLHTALSAMEVEAASTAAEAGAE